MFLFRFRIWVIFVIGLHTGVNFHLLTMFAKNSILDFPLGSEYTFNCYLNCSAFTDLWWAKSNKARNINASQCLIINSLIAGSSLPKYLVNIFLTNIVSLENHDLMENTVYMKLFHSEYFFRFWMEVSRNKNSLIISEHYTKVGPVPIISFTTEWNDRLYKDRQAIYRWQLVTRSWYRELQQMTTNGHFG